jgi:hypothetical protein
LAAHLGTKLSQSSGRPQSPHAAHPIGTEIEIDEIDPAILDGTHLDAPVIGNIERYIGVAAPRDRFAYLPVCETDGALRIKIGHLVAEPETEIEPTLGLDRRTQRGPYCQSRKPNQYGLHTNLPAPLAQLRQNRLNLC